MAKMAWRLSWQSGGSGENQLAAAGVCNSCGARYAWQWRNSGVIGNVSVAAMAKAYESASIGVMWRKRGVSAAAKKWRRNQRGGEKNTKPKINAKAISESLASAANMAISRLNGERKAGISRRKLMAASGAE
jgi:hypothetical protein